jgi:hypothetical protein
MTLSAPDRLLLMGHGAIRDDVDGNHQRPCIAFSNCRNGRSAWLRDSAWQVTSTDLPNAEQPPRHVAFVDFGSSALQVAISAFHKGKVKVYIFIVITSS